MRFMFCYRQNLPAADAQITRVQASVVPAVHGHRNIQQLDAHIFRLSWKNSLSCDRNYLH